MKNQFPGYYQPTETEFNELWANCVFVFDTNVLLNLYRYSPETSKELLDIFHSIRERIWLPHQVAEEYHKHFREVATTPPDQYNSTKTDLSRIREMLSVELGKLKNRTRISVIEWEEKIKQAFLDITRDIEDRERHHVKWLDSNWEDIANIISELFDGKVGQPYSLNQLKNIYIEGRERYEHSIPPGFGDKANKSKKSDNELFGDLISWKQIIDYSEVHKKPIILVTDDSRKGDWFWESKGKIIGPHPTLIKEIHDLAGVAFYMYPTDQFMERARNYIDAQVSDEAISEVEATRKEYQVTINLSGLGSDNTPLNSNLGFIDNAAMSFAERLGITNDFVGIGTPAFQQHESFVERLGANESPIANFTGIENPLLSQLAETQKTFIEQLAGNVSASDLIGLENPLNELLNPIEHNPTLLAHTGLSPLIDDDQLNTDTDISSDDEDEHSSK